MCFILFAYFNIKAQLELYVRLDTYLRGEGALPDVFTLENSISPGKHTNISNG